MIEPNMWRSIDTLLSKDWTMVAYACIPSFPQVNKLLIFSPRGFSDRVLIPVLESWVLLTFMSQREGVLEIVGLLCVESPRVVL